MMTQLILAGLVVAVGLVVFLRGLYPPLPSLNDRLARSARQHDAEGSDESAFQTVWARVGVWLISTLQRDRLERIQADLKVNDGTLRALAVDKLNSALGVGLFFFVATFAMNWSRKPGGLALVVFLGFGLGFLLPDIELSSKASARREEFVEALNAFVSLVAVCISGGGGVNSAMSDALEMGSSWPFVMLKDSMEESVLGGDDAWVAFDGLGRSLQIEELIELGGALGLAGGSGARVTETLQARAASGRDRERQAVLQAAERRSERMNIPIAALALSWMVFVGYAAITGMVGR